MLKTDEKYTFDFRLISECDEGWKLFEGKRYKKCLKLFQKKKKWDDAEKSCKKSDAHLVKIESKKENEFLLNTFLQLEVGELNMEAWIGLRDKEKEGKFVWTDGKPLKQKGSFTNWADEQPNNEDGQNCVEIANGVFWPGGPPQVGVWNDFQCKQKMMYICEKNREK